MYISATFFSAHITVPTRTNAHHTPLTSDGSPYSEAGALFALGLINGATGSASNELLAYLLQSLEHLMKENTVAFPSKNVPVHLHGLLLAIGCAALGSNGEYLYGELKKIIANGDVIFGQAV
jgi:hypothetical protein